MVYPMAFTRIDSWLEACSYVPGPNSEDTSSIFNAFCYHMLTNIHPHLTTRTKIPVALLKVFIL